jgi:hypothetical protein
LTNWLLFIAGLTVIANGFLLIVKHLVASEWSSRLAICIFPFVKLELAWRLVNILLFIISKLGSILSKACTQIALIIVEDFFLLLVQAQLMILFPKYINQVLL